MTDDDEAYEHTQEARRQLGDMLARVLDDVGDKAVVTRAVIVYEIDHDPTDPDAPVTLDYRSAGGLTDVDFIGLLDVALTLMRDRAVKTYTHNHKDDVDDVDDA